MMTDDDVLKVAQSMEALVEMCAGIADAVVKGAKLEIAKGDAAPTKFVILESSVMTAELISRNIRKLLPELVARIEAARRKAAGAG